MMDLPTITASGFDPTQFEAEDIEALHSLCKLRSLDCAPSFGLQTHPAELDVPPTRNLRLKIAPLPRHARLRAAKLEPPRLRLHRDLAAAWRVPIRRRRMLATDLPREQGAALLKAVLKKYGREADSLHISAVFQEVPAELASRLALEDNLRAVEFDIPIGTKLVGLSTGCYLVVLEKPDGATRKAIFRL